MSRFPSFLPGLGMATVTAMNSRRYERCAESAQVRGRPSPNLPESVGGSPGLAALYGEVQP
jgi:hypothetical protein